MRPTIKSQAARAKLVAAIESLENRRLLCSLPHEHLAPTPAFDWKIEQQYAASQLRSGVRGEPRAVGIVWANRGQASDGFAAAFGSSAEAGRVVVDAVFNQWGRIIQSFNRSDGTSTLQVNVSVTGNSFGAAGGPEAFPPADHKPRTGSITVGAGSVNNNPNDANGWFFDPTPMDNAEFLGSITTPYNSRATNASQGVDFFSVINAELAHCLGLISDVNNSNGAYGEYTLEDFSDITNIRDNAEGGGNFGFFQVFNGPNIDHLMTSYNSGDATSLSWGNVIHTSGGGSLSFNGTTWVGTQDEGNALYDGGERQMPSFVVARILGDAYGYTINDPEQFATAHTVLNTSNGVLTVRGSSSSTSSDLIVIDTQGSELVITVDIGEDIPGSGHLAGAGNLDAYVTRVPLSSVNSINVLGGGGQDFIRVERNGGKPTTVNGEGGDDFIDFGFYNRNLTNQSASVTAFGGSGSDQVFVHDTIVSTPQTFTITSSRFDRPSWGGVFYWDDIEALTLTTGTGADTVNVRSTFAGQPVHLNSAGGNDVVNVGNTSNGVQSIQADVFVNNSPALSTLNINDNTNAGPTNSNVDFHGSTGYGRINNLAPARILWNMADTASVNITTGTAADTLLIYSNTEAMNINSAGGNDNVQIGDAIVGGLPFITGAINVNNSNGFTNLTVTDAGSNVAKSANMDFAGSSTFGRVTNLAPVPVVWVNARMASVNVITGNMNDTMLLYSNNTPQLRYDSAGGNDTLFIGWFTVGGLQFVGQTVSVDNSNGTTEVVVDDDGATVNKTAVTVTHPAGTYTQVQSFAPGTLRFNDSGISQVQLRSGNVTNILSDKFDVYETSVPLFFFNNGGPDAVNIGGGPQGADGVLAPVTVFGAAATTTVGFIDYGSNTGRAVTMDDDGTIATVTGFGPANHSLYLSTMTSTTFAFGNAADTLQVLRARKRVAVANNTANNPTDTVTVGNPTNGLDDIQANIEQIIALSPIAFTLDDAVSTAGRTYNFQPQFFQQILTGNRIVFNGVNYLSHTMGANAESVSIISGSGDDTFNVPIARTPAFYLYGNGGNDTFNLATHATQFSDPVYILGDGGLDVLNVNADGASTGSAVMVSTMHFSSVTLGDGGDMTVSNGGDKLLSTQSLSIGVDSTIDLADNDLIVDYTGASELAAVQQLINEARNGGAWDGVRGITSSVAAAAVPANRTLGAMEASEFDAIYGPGAIFAGDAVDADMVLVKHTYYGDADFNGVVNFDDYARTDAGFSIGRTGWLNGDYDGNGSVNFDDYSLIDLAFNSQGAAL